MKVDTYQVELLTPCFCAGADQSKAEIRVPSIRGELRWWFRALGGTPEQEKKVFGGVHALEGERKADAAKASAVRIRISAEKRERAWSPPRVDPNDPLAYVWYFASVSGERKGMRWTEQGSVAPGSTFVLTIGICRPLAEDLQALLQRATEAMLRFGGIGLRVTRGLGAFRAASLPGSLDDEKRAAAAILEHAGFATVWVGNPFESWEKALTHAGALLKFVLRKQENVKRSPASPLGASNRPRQRSAVRFRVVRVAPGDWRLLLFEAPHERVLEPNSRRSEPLILTLRRQILDFTGAPQSHRFGPRRPGGGGPGRQWP